MPIFIPIMPEGAIIRPSDLSSERPTKTRVSGAATQNVSLDFPEGVSASAVWRFLLPAQNRMGMLSTSDVEFVLRYTSQDVNSGNVGWQIQVGLSDTGDPFDDITSATFSDLNVSTNQAFSGSVGDEQENTVTIFSILNSLDVAKNYTLYVKITRCTVSSDLAGGVSLLPSFLFIQTSQLGDVLYTGSYNANTTLTADNIRNTLIIGDTSGGPVVLELPSLTTSDAFLRFTVVREGADLLSLLSPDPAYRIIYPAYTDDQTYEMNADGDSVSLVYVHAVQTYYVIG